MPLFDKPLPELREYRPERSEPADFDRFWQDTLAKAETDPLEPAFVRYDAGLSTVDVWDVRFTGFGGHRIAGWFLAPRDVPGPLPTVVQYLGYQGGRNWPIDWLVYPAAGYAVLVMDTRGQGTDTADPDPGANPQVPGFLTRGLVDRDSYYYRRVFTDAVRAVDAARTHPIADPARIVVAGGSQGGGIAQAVAGLRTDVAAALIDVPFLTHFRRAAEMVDKTGYGEIADYLARRRVPPEEVFGVLDYFDGVNLAARATAPARYSVALMDAVCPPSTVFAAYNHYRGPADIDVWPFNGHEGGAQVQRMRQLRWLTETL
jgi:cephalosporin-C deacetylase